MKIFNVILRCIFGLLLLFASVTYFFKFSEQPAPTGDLKNFNDGIIITKYLMPLVKTIELFAGLCYVSGRFIALANLVLLPVSINILLVNIFLAPKVIPIGLFIFSANAYFIYTKWNSYKSIFTEM